MLVGNVIVLEGIYLIAFNGVIETNGVNVSLSVQVMS